MRQAGDATVNFMIRLMTELGPTFQIYLLQECGLPY